MNEKFERTRYEVHYQSKETGKWMTIYRSATTFEKAEEQLIEHKKSNKLLDSFIALSKPAAYQIVKVESKCEVIKTYENRTA